MENREWGDPFRWMDMTEGQRGIYMEFYAPVLENNLKRMPENEEYISIDCCTPIQEHIDAFTNWDGTINETGENLTRQASYIHESLTGSQKKAIIYWLTELGEDEEDVGDEEVDEINGW
tara:strand:- start:224 stop:580 length:357 start_codon:yes stop_codon:yes gene_type:complete